MRPSLAILLFVSLHGGESYRAVVNSFPFAGICMNCSTESSRGLNQHVRSLTDALPRHLTVPCGTWLLLGHLVKDNDMFLRMHEMDVWLQ